MNPDLYVISDLHLCDGSAVEDFLPDDDAALAGFLDAIRAKPQAALIINGDFIDFVQVQPGGGRYWFNEDLDASEDQSLEKLEHIIAAHGPVFDALGRFVGAGRTLRFHYGNHDIDLVWPRLQERIRERLGQPGKTDLITFGDSTLIGGVYIEHGHQADKHTNCFPDQPRLTRTGPDGVERLTRCWGTRFVEEFYNKIEALPGCGMLDNVRPRMQAAVVIIKHMILTPAMYPTLRAGMRVILSTLAELKTEKDFTNAAGELGVSRLVVEWIVKVACWLGVSPAPPQAKGLDPSAPPEDALEVPSLREAYVEGAAVRDPEELLRMAPPDTAPESKGFLGDLFGGEKAPAISPQLQKSLEYVRSEVLPRQPGASHVCVGHTHLVTAEGVNVSGGPALYHNSGSWTMTLDLEEAGGVSFGYLQDAANFRKGRDYLHVRWPDGETPQVENHQWSAA